MHSFVRSAHLIGPRRQCRFLVPLASSGFKKQKAQLANPSPSGPETGGPSQLCAICPGVLLCRDKVLAGADLLQELQSLRSDTEVGEAWT